MNKVLMAALGGTVAGVLISTQFVGPLLAQEGGQNLEVYQQLDMFGDAFERIRGQYVEKPDSQKLIDILQNQMNTLNQKRIPVERMPTVSIPVEPVRTVTTVTMKPNAVKPTATPIIQSLDSAPSAPAAVTKVNMASIAMHSANVSEDTSSVLSTSVTTNAMEVVSHSETTPVNIPVAAPNVLKPVVSFTPPDLSGAAATIVPRHKKGGTRPRGCPCCDPDNLDNIIDSMLFSHYPQT